MLSMLKPNVAFKVETHEDPPVNSIDNPIAAIRLISVKALKSTPHNAHIP